MATYNGSSYLEQQLNSFERQTIKPDEVVICDDDSSDNTRDIINEIAEKAPFKIKLFKNKKKIGISQNFSKAINLCKGDYIFLSDQDDYWFSDKIEKMIFFSRKNKDSFVFYNNCEYADKNLEPTGRGKMQELKKLNMDFVQGSCVLIKKEFLEIINPIPRKIAHDSWIFQLSYILSVQKTLKDSLQFYRIHGNNFSNFNQNKFIKKNIISFLGNKKISKNKIMNDINKEINLLNNSINRLVLSKKKVAQLLKNRDLKTTTFELKKRMLIKRKKIIKLKGLEKYFKMFQFFFSLKYSRFFNGYKSFLRDLISN